MPAALSAGVDEDKFGANASAGESGKRVQNMTMDVNASDTRRQGKYPLLVITLIGEKCTPIW